MLGTRYEEWGKFDTGLPFRLNADITVTPLLCQHEANWHNNLELQLCTDGEGSVTISREKYTFRKNDIIIVNSNEIHHTSTEQKLRYHCIIVDLSFCRNIGIDSEKIYFKPHLQSERLTALVTQLVEIYNGQDLCRTARLYEIILKILIDLREHHTLSQNSWVIANRDLDKSKIIIKYIRENYAKKISLNELSQIALVDKFTMSRLFKKATNQTIVQYINSYRCKKVIDYITDGVSVSEAAQNCGFNNMSFFTKTFKAYVGCLPSKYCSLYGIKR